MTRRKSAPAAIEPFVVVVSFPSNSWKEYHYLCNDPLVRQGSTVIANGTKVKVIRTAPVTPGSLATKYVQSDHASDARERRIAITKRLLEIESREQLAARFLKLKSPEAKKLLAELKGLN